MTGFPKKVSDVVYQELSNLIFICSGTREGMTLNTSLNHNVVLLYSVSKHHPFLHAVVFLYQRSFNYLLKVRTLI